MYISDHFHIGEASKSAVAIRHGINNTTPQHLHSHLELMAHNILEPIRDEYGEPFSPHSWYRCDKLNQLVGGSEHSFHMQGLAVDLELLGWDNDDFAYWCAEHLDYDRIILEYHQQEDSKSGWTHIQIMPDCHEHRKEFLIFDGQGFHYV